ncbi:MAG: hypothetical protein COA49_01655 [Bacteroidetes bacterium]|nr:MAG: hypothetical protein COA49_01655 [Bacteroidota bacterium]
MKFHEPRTSTLFLLFLVVLLYLVPFLSLKFESKIEPSIDVVKENIPVWADFTSNKDVDSLPPIIVNVPEISQEEDTTSLEAIISKPIEIRSNFWSPDYDTCTVKTIALTNTFYGSKEARNRLYKFFESLNGLSSNDTEPLHIFHFGDSQIEGDRITGRLRSSWQKSWGGSGPGLLPAIQPISSLAIRQEHEGSIKRFTRFGRVDTTLGHTNYGAMAALSVIHDSATILLHPHPLGFIKNQTWHEMEILFGSVPMGGIMSIYGEKTDSVFVDIPPSAEGAHNSIKVRLAGEKEDLVLKIEGYEVEVTGIRLGSSRGVQIHNIPMRGSSGTIFTRIGSDHLRRYLSEWNVGMVILQYGGNTAPYVKTEESANRYGTRFGRQVRYFHKLLPDAAILVIGPSDMGETMDSTNLTYPMLGEIRRALKEETIKEGGLYWDLSEAMGGPGTMSEWSTSSPKLASPDLVHFTPKGARIIGEKLDMAFRAEYRTWEYLVRNNGSGKLKRASE